ncbi:hypothetical protein BN1723_000683 [Verticillium longisporum]|uniref:Aminoacyl-transfer RNA synthetases class-II family profile domain-containing protein n=1 Tax=Verticillium longisporum TaxID=100787 RepID=A0A0G4MY57_VERLO|nr:hypothetical protein BN1723_000683 [Verticillium longisporum]
MLPSRLARQALRCFHRPHQIPRTLLAKPSRFSSTKATPPRNDSPELPDHRKVGAQQELFMTSIYSPGSPIFLPNGARIFNRLVDFLRRQYVSYGFEEVITPNIYKKSLWEVSGHLQNYADDMYTDAAHPGYEIAAHTEETKVFFVQEGDGLPDDVVDAYVKTREGADKAGGYALQGMGGILLVDRIDGGFDNVIGLPVRRALALAERVIFKQNVEEEADISDEDVQL